MEWFVQTFLSTCMLLSIVGFLVWCLYLSAAILMFIFPYALAVIVGALLVTAFIAWRRSNGS